MKDIQSKEGKKRRIKKNKKAGFIDFIDIYCIFSRHMTLFSNSLDMNTENYETPNSFRQNSPSVSYSGLILIIQIVSDIYGLSCVVLSYSCEYCRDP